MTLTVGANITKLDTKGEEDIAVVVIHNIHGFMKSTGNLVSFSLDCLALDSANLTNVSSVNELDSCCRNFFSKVENQNMVEIQSAAL